MKHTLQAVLSKSRLAAVIGAGLMLMVLNAHAGSIRVATEGAYPPFNFMDAAGQPQGFDVDIARALCKAMNEICTIVTQDWDGMIPALLVKKYDVIIASMSITDERLKKVDFTKSYYKSGLSFIAKTSADYDVNSVEGKTIGAQRSTVAAQYAEDKLGSKNTIRLYDTQENLYLDVKAGRVEAFVSDMLPAYEWLKSDDGENFERKGENFEMNDLIGIALRKNSPLKAKFNKAIDTIVKNGTYERINRKYFPFSIY